jgi:mono/diheme cytochrome c family protein
MTREALWTAAAVALTATMAAAQPRVTFNREVAPLLNAHCVTCHRPDGDAPFSLATFEDARRHASQIVAVTRTRFMPPWKPDPEGGPFVGERRLRDDELDLLRRWVDEGALEGEATSARPQSPSLPPGGWQLGTPDVVLTLAP